MELQKFGRCKYTEVMKRINAEFARKKSLRALRSKEVQEISISKSFNFPAKIDEVF